MRYFIPTIENGTKIPLDVVESKRLAVKEKILESGLQYIETEAIVGNFNAMASRIESKAYVIESISPNIFV